MKSLKGCNEKQVGSPKFNSKISQHWKSQKHLNVANTTTSTQHDLVKVKEKVDEKKYNQYSSGHIVSPRNKMLKSKESSIDASLKEAEESFLKRVTELQLKTEQFAKEQLEKDELIAQLKAQNSELRANYEKVKAQKEQQSKVLKAKILTFNSEGEEVRRLRKMVEEGSNHSTILQQKQTQIMELQKKAATYQKEIEELKVQNKNLHSQLGSRVSLRGELGERLKVIQKLNEKNTQLIDRMASFK